jgi:glutamine synthetase
VGDAQPRRFDSSSSFKPGRESSRRVEYRSPDAACNPYLVFALLLAAGLEGIQNDYNCPTK